MRKIAFVLALMSVLTLLAGCGATKELHCDHCGLAVEVPESSEMNEDWILFCKDCEKELFGEDGLVKPVE